MSPLPLSLQGLCQVTFPWDDKENLKYHKQAQRVRPVQFRTWINSAFFGEVWLLDMQEMCFMEKLFKLSELMKSLSNDQVSGRISGAILTLAGQFWKTKCLSEPALTVLGSWARLPECH